MCDLLSPLLFVVGEEADAFWCFAALMERVGLNFHPDQTGMQLQLHLTAKVPRGVGKAAGAAGAGAGAGAGAFGESETGYNMGRALLTPLSSFLAAVGGGAGPAAVGLPASAGLPQLLLLLQMDLPPLQKVPPPLLCASWRMNHAIDRRSKIADEDWDGQVALLSLEALE